MTSENTVEAKLSKKRRNAEIGVGEAKSLSDDLTYEPIDHEEYVLDDVPCPAKRIKGVSYNDHGTIKVWGGLRWKCQHEISRCEECKHDMETTDTSHFKQVPIVGFEKYSVSENGEVFSYHRNRLMIVNIERCRKAQTNPSLSAPNE